MLLALPVPNNFMLHARSFTCATIGMIKSDYSMTPEEKANALEEDLEKKDLLGELVRRSRQGDDQAMGAIYEQYKTPLFNLACRYTYNSAVAEDLLQDIFIKVFTHLQNLKNDEAFVGWLYRIAINTCLSYVRSKKGILQKEIPLNEVEGRLHEGRNHIQDKMMNKPLESAIQDLSSKLRSVFLLHDVQGFKHKEVAQILGLSVGTSKSQLFKARMKIRKQLEKKRVI